MTLLLYFMPMGFSGLFVEQLKGMRELIISSEKIGCILGAKSSVLRRFAEKNIEGDR